VDDHDAPPARVCLSETSEAVDVDEGLEALGLVDDHPLEPALHVPGVRGPGDAAEQGRRPRHFRERASQLLLHRRQIAPRVEGRRGRSEQAGDRWRLGVDDVAEVRLDDVADDVADQRFLRLRPPRVRAGGGW
jgi:hypothetical protein